MSIDEIHRICLKYDITNYTINDDGSIDVNGNVDISSIKLKKIPLNFRNVSGRFDCSNNLLTSLKGSPISVGSSFICYDNNLTSMEFSPILSAKNFYVCYYNPLTSLKGIPINIPEIKLYLPDEYTYDDYIEYSRTIERNIKFKKILEK